MKLNADQIEKIKAFIQKRGFTYLDVQLEILDHVACKVEAKLTENPNMSFDDALRKTHAEFGVFGFQSLEEPFVKNLEKKFFRMKWESFKSWIKIPQLLILVLALLATYLVSGILEGNALWVFPLGVILYFLIFQMMVWRKLKPYRKLAIMKSFWVLNFLYFMILLQSINFYVQQGGRLGISVQTISLVNVLLVFLALENYRSTKDMLTYTTERCDNLLKLYGEI